MRQPAPRWLGCICAGLALLPCAAAAQDAKPLRAGAASVDVSPPKYPVLVNGGFLEATATKLADPVFAKAVVLDDGTTKLAMAVVDSCMMPRELIDLAKKLAAEKTGIPEDKILVSATHTHTAPAAMGALGCRADGEYVKFLPDKIAEAIEQAAGRLEPARVGWNVIDDPKHTHCRRWIRRPDRMIEDPFGARTVRANMHPGYVNPDAIAPSGPVDPGLTVLSVQAKDGRPIAVLANYSMHYFGSTPVSADYYGRFAAALAKQIGAEKVDPPFVGMMSQGTSGDQMWMDYGRPQDNPGIDRYAEEVAEVASSACKRIEYRESARLAMSEAKLKLRRRVPDEARLAWARRLIAEMGERKVPKTIPEVYALEAVYLHEEPERELKLQAVGIGDLGIAAIPDEVFALTGLKIKASSPFPTTMNIELANGSEGYIPPPEQHALGGYTTWPARTAGLEVEAEPKIVDVVLGLLEAASGKPRRTAPDRPSAYADAVLKSKPLAFWRLDDMAGRTALDSSGNGRHAAFEPGVAYYLPGADRPGLASDRLISRAAHFAGGRLVARPEGIGGFYSIEFWFWNGLPNDARPITGHLLGIDLGKVATHLSLAGAQGPAAEGRLFFSHGPDGGGVIAGKTPIAPKTWNHVVYVREGGRVAAYLNGREEHELYGDSDSTAAAGLEALFVGGGQGRENSFEGKIDEVAVYDRPLTRAEIAEHYRAAGEPGR
jgi:hypothetical protein